jgi:ABC-type multidrug transport system ATPase subunit
MALVMDRVRRRGAGGRLILDLTLRIPPGVTAVMGPNGSGKTTLLKIAGGLLPPEYGSVYFKGVPVYPRAGAEKAGYVPQENVIPLPLKVKDALHYLGVLYGAPARQVNILAAEWGLEELAARPLNLLSPGQSRRFLIAQCFLQAHELWILDEATTGLDPFYRPLLIEKINELNRNGATVLMATHYTADLSAAADYLLELAQGRAAYHGCPARS